MSPASRSSPRCSTVPPAKCPPQRISVIPPPRSYVSPDQYSMHGVGPHDPLAVVLVQQDRAVERTPPLDHRRVVVRVRDRDRVQRADAVDRLVVEQRDAVPQDVRRPAARAGRCRTWATYRSPRNAPSSANRLWCRPAAASIVVHACPDDRHVLPRVLTDGARGHRSAVLHPAGHADGVAHAPILSALNAVSREFIDRHQHPARHPGAAGRAHRRGHPARGLSGFKTRCWALIAARLDRARRRRDRARPRGRRRPHVVRADPRPAGCGARARLGDARRQAGLRAHRRRRRSSVALIETSTRSAGDAAAALPARRSAHHRSAACSPAWSRRRR